jgi:hypothetical protein
MVVSMVGFLHQCGLHSLREGFPTSDRFVHFFLQVSQII